MAQSLGHSILWIEDQHDEYNPLLDDLHDLVGHDNVVVACTLDEGRARLRTQPFDLLLLDLMLPNDQTEYEMELIHLDAGQRLLRELRQNTDWKTPRTCGVVVLTARGNLGALAEVRELLGPSDHLLQKPLPIEHIVQVVRDTLDKVS